MKISVVALTALLAMSAHAQIVSISLSGTITGVVHDGGTLPSQITAGEPWSATFNYETGANAPNDLAPAGNFGQYRPVNSPNSFQFSIGDAGDFPLIPGDTAYLLEVFDDGANEQLTFSTDHVWSHTDPANGAITYGHDPGHAPHIILQGNQNALGGDDLPMGGLNIAQFNQTKTFTFTSSYDPPGPLVFASHQISGTVDAISLTIIPEPQHYALIGAFPLLLTALILRRRRMQAA